MIYIEGVSVGVIITAGLLIGFQLGMIANMFRIKVECWLSRKIIERPCCNCWADITNKPHE